MSDSPFPFFKLPTLVQLLIINNFHLSELFILSLISQQARNIAKQVASKIYQLSIFISEQKKTYSIRIENESENVKIEFSKSPSEQYFQWKIQKQNEWRVPNNVSRRFKLVWDLCWRDELSETKCLEQKNKFISDVIIVSRFEFDSDCLVELEKCPLLNCSTNWDNLVLRENPEQVLSGKDLKFILENLNIKHLYLRCDTEVDFKYSGPLKMDVLTLNGSNWLTLDAIRSMECREVENRDPSNTFSDNDLNAIIKCWMAGGLGKLEKFHVNMLLDDSEERLNRILEGIETMAWIPENRPRDWCGWDISTGRDLRRSDGLFATVVMDGFFHFVVWHPKRLR